jgi:hypothetical protein
MPSTLTCLEQRRSFVPFVLFTDGLIGREAENLLKQIALRLTAKWEQPYSVVRGFVDARINLATLRATNLRIRLQWPRWRRPRTL